jgi:hypothetical protein
MPPAMMTPFPSCYLFRAVEHASTPVLYLIDNGK